MKKVIIVGAGIAGLSAGIYARKSGFDVTIVESHAIPGGNCTAWRRNGYLFEGGMHWLNGSGPEKSHNKLWKEVGALNEGTKIFNTDPFLVCEYDGKRAAMHRDVKEFEEHLSAVSPEDIPLIKKMCRDIRRFRGFGIPVRDIPGLKVREKAPGLRKVALKAISLLPRIIALGRISAGDYARRFRSPAIRLLLLKTVNPGYDALSLFFILSCFMSGDGGYIEGGSLKLIQNMADRFVKAGGILRCNTKANRVLVKDGRTAGVETKDGIIPADAVIVAADTLAAVDTLFEAPLHEGWADILRCRETTLIVNTFISIGVKADLSSLPETMVFPLEKPFEFGGFTINHLNLNNYAPYPEYAPKGCTAITSSISVDTYDYWKNAREQGAYDQRKRELFEAVLSRLEERFPLIKGKAETWDVATPLTYERFCGTYHGSWMTITPPGHRRTIYPSKAKKIKGLYFAGQRIQPPGGMPVALITGRRAVQYLCRDFGAVFG
ncbi:phytoene desaturase family protein [Leadbettera azotonutricia]|uniref:Putative FAD dependent oxidoreductase n=1 Tax=Leadbettera azotonutricia (strain ATCC BAA-888 / DSM 13862 / ZAS-9) TaxID=545695 RepID=F5YFZ0_LEAAZ|nr:NAD(P)/FAD-dependent oxidoreductase [Leadbettera azotonutricia]AEF82205.1 putative FAD dependent oxidoreductase [Leadbettera azotonutricia ZAS-9]